MKTTFTILLPFFIAISFYSCQPDGPAGEIKTPFDYYPLEIGKYITYAVDSIQYFTIGTIDSSHYEVKELLVDTFYDNDGRLNYRVERSARLNDTMPWIIQNEWSVLATENQIQKIENNLRFIKLTSPVVNGANWEGNIFLGGLEDLPFNEECNRLTYLYGWIYAYEDVDQPFSVNGFEFDKTIKVTQSGDDNLIWYGYAEEIYANGVGLVQKEFFHYWTQDTSCPTCPWEERAECGYSVKMKIIDYN
ncbi:MAG: hypothetical protein ACHQFW_07710 [Chitinophagales bacterium]